MRSLLTHVSEARRQLEEVVQALGESRPKAANQLRDAADDVPAYTAFPEAHWRQILSTNPLERRNKQIRRRTRVIGICPHCASALRLVTMLLWEQHDEWQVVTKAYFS